MRTSNIDNRRRFQLLSDEYVSCFSIGCGDLNNSAMEWISVCVRGIERISHPCTDDDLVENFAQMMNQCCLDLCEHVERRGGWNGNE